MDNFIQTQLSQRMADAIIRLANSLTTPKKQYTKYCAKYEAHDVISSNIESGSRFVSLFNDGEYCTIIFEEGEEK